MTAAVLKTVSFAKPVFAKPVFSKPSQATLQKIETVLAFALIAQVIGLIVRYAM